VITENSAPAGELEITNGDVVLNGKREACERIIASGRRAGSGVRATRRIKVQERADLGVRCTHQTLIGPGMIGECTFPVG